jgi:hypothetical protein
MVKVPTINHLLNAALQWWLVAVFCCEDGGGNGHAWNVHLQASTAGNQCSSQNSNSMQHTTLPEQPGSKF